MIVRESQRAVFFRDGKALDVFGPGRHTIASANIPKLIDFVGRLLATGHLSLLSVLCFGEGICRSQVGHPQPIIVKNPGMGLGVALLQGFGTYSFQVADPIQFMRS